MRKNLKEARRKAGMTQKQVADYLGITLRSYQRIEDAQFLGSIRNWDALEDLEKWYNCACNRVWFLRASTTGLVSNPSQTPARMTR